MLRILPFAFLVAVVGLAFVSWPGFVGAEEPAASPPVAKNEPAKAPEKPIPALAAEEQAKEALRVFKKDWVARGFKGDEKTAMREVAMRKLARTQHAKIADRLYRLTRDRNEDIRTLAVMYLGEQRALPGYAGQLVIKAIQTNKTDAVFVMFAVDALDNLKYRGVVPLLKELMSHKDDGVKKVAILTVGDMGEMRMFEDLLKLAKDLKIDKGWKTEGHEVRVDTGAAGDADQKAAEAEYARRYGSSSKKGRKAGRAMRDMKPVLLEAMKRLTGEEFYGRKQAEAWAEEHDPEVRALKKELSETEKAQDAAAKEMK